MACACRDRCRTVHGRPRHRHRQRRAAVDQGRPATSPPENLQWVVSAYAILFGGALLLGGRLADIFGRRRLFMIGLALFSGASLLCGVSWSEGSLIAFRALQGLGGALFAPAALSILMTTFAEGAERNRALGIWGAASGSGGAAGVLLGGVPDLVPELAVGLLHQRAGRDRGDRRGAGRCCAESRGQHGHRHFDVAGAASVTAGVMLLVYAMTRATQDGWVERRDARPAGRLGGAARRLRRHRAALAGAAAADADLPRCARCRPPTRRPPWSARSRSRSSSC